MEFMYSAHQEETALDALRYWSSEEDNIYIEKSREKLNFALSREMFDREIEFVNPFRKRFEAECDGDIDF
ncbi:hypothetical protein [Paenibacillus sp. NFR01]|uniref:hypothetical protein n=1 Tax=Paenibacillus sp. NFR01 TaxID=1566279 RepID=UPI0008B25824|nr:hypothetical protein [Paenibacillus sp. NFR01]SET21513.1 hypothetical protein SAMN03159358_1037 [Paenibacillus sp. NFR01]